MRYVPEWIGTLCPDDDRALWLYSRKTCSKKALARHRWLERLRKSLDTLYPSIFGDNVSTIRAADAVPNSSCSASVVTPGTYSSYIRSGTTVSGTLLLETSCRTTAPHCRQSTLRIWTMFCLFFTLVFHLGSQTSLSPLFRALFLSRLIHLARLSPCTI